MPAVTLFKLFIVAVQQIHNVRCDTAARWLLLLLLLLPVVAAAPRGRPSVRRRGPGCQAQAPLSSLSSQAPRICRVHLRLLRLLCVLPLLCLLRYLILG